MVLARKHPKIGIHYVKLILYKKIFNVLLRSNHRFSKIDYHDQMIHYKCVQNRGESVSYCL